MRTIEVFGSQTLRIKPDLATVGFSLMSKSIEPTDAAANVVEKSEAILQGLNEWRIASVDSSQAQLTKKSQSNNEVVFYEASMTCEVTTPDVDRITDMQLKIAKLGAENIAGTHFISTKLQEHRKQARMEAMRGALAKANYYCEAANIKLGPPITIEDVDPSGMEFRRSGHRIDPFLEELQSPDVSDEVINVSGAVRVLFELIVDDFHP